MKVPSEKQTPNPPSPSNNPFEHRVARAISACCRCRARKSKCDGKLPACSACEKAKVECIGFDAISKKNVSRSYIHELEQEVLTLRAQLGLPPNGAPPPPQQQTPHPLSQSHSQSQSPFNFDTPSSSSRGPGNTHTHARSASFVGPGEHSIDPSLLDDHQRPGSAGRGYDSRQSMDGAMRPPAFFDRHAHQGQQQSYERSSLSHSVTQGQSLPTSQEINHVVSDIAYLGPLTSSSHPSPHPQNVGHFMGASSGVSLTRMVLDAVLRNGPAAPALGADRRDLGERRGSEGGRDSRGSGRDEGVIKMEPAMSRALSPSSPPRRDSYLPNPNLSDRRQSHPYPQIDIPALPPPAAVDRLVQVYVDFVQIMLPILHMPTFGDRLRRVQERGADVTESDVFFVLMVLALSTMALSRSLDPTAELRMSSEAFFMEAVKHMEAVFEDRTYIGLQAILLCCYYCLLNPSRGSIWFLVGLASRCCVDHGFHHETEQTIAECNPLELDMRRRLFAAVYNLDRLLSHSLGRPPSIPDDYIDVAPFSSLPDEAITEHGLLPAEPDRYKIVSLNFIPLRELQSAINSRLYSVRSSEPPSQEWFLRMFEQLKNWLANSPEPKGAQSTEGYAISFHNTVLLLFRPSPACPRPSRDALATCLSSSSYIIRIFRRMHRNNKINWYWLSSHYVFMAGITYLYGLWNMNLLGDSSMVPSLTDAVLDIQACLSTLGALAVTVPSAVACRATFEMLSTAIIKRLTGEAQDQSSGESNDGDHLRATMSSRGASTMGGSPMDGSGPIGPAESSMRHTFQAHGYISPLPKLSLPNELHLLDNLFLNPMVPHPKASESTTVGQPGFCSAGAENNQGNGSNGNGNGMTFNGMDATTPQFYINSNNPQAYKEDPSTSHAGPGPSSAGPSYQTNLVQSPPAAFMQNFGGPGGAADGDLAAGGFDFLSFLAQDDGGQGANAVWEQTEMFRQDMPMLG